MTVYGYLRVSTDEQARSGLGRAAQRSAIAVEAARHGWAVVYATEDGVSGSVTPEDRPSLGQVLEQLTAGDVLVVAKLDRLGRSALDVLRLAEAARDRRWRLVLLDLGLDTATPVGAFTLAALAAVAQLERDLIAQRTRDAMQAAKQRGARFGGPIRLPTDVRERIEAEHKAGASLTAIARGLNADCVPTAQGGSRWHHSTVRAVLRSLDLDREAYERRAS